MDRGVRIIAIGFAATCPTPLITAPARGSRFMTANSGRASYGGAATNASRSEQTAARIRPKVRPPYGPTNGQATTESGPSEAPDPTSASGRVSSDWRMQAAPA